MNKKLYRNKNLGILGGVCTGLAQYFEIDVVLIRAAFAVSFLMGGVGLLFYIVLWIILPSSDHPVTETEKTSNPEMKKKNAQIIGGLVLIMLGILFLAEEFIPWISFHKFWPLILVTIGIGLLYSNFNKKDKNQNTNDNI